MKQNLAGDDNLLLCLWLTPDLWLLVAGCCLQLTAFCLLLTDLWPLTSGCLFLVAGCSFLLSAFCLLLTGFSLLVDRSCLQLIPSLDVLCHQGIKAQRKDMNFKIFKLALMVLRFCSVGSTKPDINQGVNSNELYISSP